MTQQNSKLPLGIQDFEEMRRDHYIYADKTDMVWKLANGTKYNYLTVHAVSVSLFCVLP